MLARVAGDSQCQDVRVQALGTNPKLATPLHASNQGSRLETQNPTLAGVVGRKDPAPGVKPQATHTLAHVQSRVQAWRPAQTLRLRMLSPQAWASNPRLTGVAGESQCQDEMLRQLPAVAEQTEYAVLRSELLPRLHTLCLKTTSAGVRVSALTCMGRVAPRLDQDEAGQMLQTAAKVRGLLGFSIKFPLWWFIFCLALPRLKAPKHTDCFFVY